MFRLGMFGGNVIFRGESGFKNLIEVGDVVGIFRVMFMVGGRIFVRESFVLLM